MYLDYGPGIELNSVLVPTSIDWRPSSANLTISEDYELHALHAHCHVVQELQFGIFKAMQALQNTT
jgi:hypothetical protein